MMIIKRGLLKQITPIEQSLIARSGWINLTILYEVLNHYSPGEFRSEFGRNSSVKYKKTEASVVEIEILTAVPQKYKVYRLGHGSDSWHIRRQL